VVALPLSAWCLPLIIYRGVEAVEVTLSPKPSFVDMGGADFEALLHEMHRAPAAVVIRLVAGISGFVVNDDV